MRHLNDFLFLVFLNNQYMTCARYRPIIQSISIIQLAVAIRRTCNNKSGAR